MVWKTALVCLSLGMAATPLIAQDAPHPADEARAERERAFAEQMTGVELTGFFTHGEVTADTRLRGETYTITKVEKVVGDTWRFDCRIQYADKDVTLPIALPVHWAGDTPVITVTDVQFPGLGQYTARVLIYEGHYAGFWKPTGGVGGHLFGTIRKIDAEQSGAP